MHISLASFIYKCVPIVDTKMGTEHMQRDIIFNRYHQITLQSECPSLPSHREFKRVHISPNAYIKYDVFLP